MRHRHRSRSGDAIAALVLGLVVASTPLSALSAVQAWVDSQTVDEMESVRLMLRADGIGNQVDTQLDLSELERDFEVLGTNTSSQFQITHGQTQSWIEYQITLRPKRTGTLTIPPIAVTGESSQPLQLTVRPLPPEVRRAIDRMVFFEVEVSPNPVYVQAQALISRRLYYLGGVQIYSDLPGAPDIPNAVVIPVGDTHSTTEVRPEGRYGVLEQRYAIFPEQSGALTIPEISVTSSVRLQSGGRTRRSDIRVSTPEIRLEVLPVPAAYPADQPWLPAKQVSISDVWEPGTLAFRVGEPARRTLIVNITGNTGSAIPPLDLHLPAAVFKQYPEPVAIDEEAVAMDVVGRREQPYSIVPVAPGRPRLPEIRLTWWDTVNERVRVATATAEQAQIAGNPGASQPSAASTPPLVDDPAGANAAPLMGERSGANTPSPTEEQTLGNEAAAGGSATPEADPPAGAEAVPTSYPTWLVALALFAFCGWGGTWLIMRRDRTQTAARQHDSSMGKTWQALATACRLGDAKSVRDAWVRYLGERWKSPPDRTVAKLREHPEGRRLLDALNRSLYSPAAGEAPDYQEILAFSRSLRKHGKQRRDEPLPELYAG